MTLVDRIELKHRQLARAERLVLEIKRQLRSIQIKAIDKIRKENVRNACP